MLNRIFIALFFLLVSSRMGQAQVPTFQDCLGATPICLNSYATGNVITGTGNIPNEINPVNSCLLTGERNDAWYIITTGSSGNLNFSIIPNNPLHNYDWALFNLTSAICSEIFTNPALEISCNYSNLPGITGANGLAGAQNNSVIPVNSGQTYLLNVSGFSTINQSGYTIDLSNSTATVIDNTSPSLSGLTAMNCGATTLVASFSERVLCNSVQPSDFTLTGPGGPFTINAVTSTACAAGASYARDYSISFSPAIPGAGLYTLSLVNPVTDLCSNTAAVPQAFPVPISGINITFQKVDVTCFGGNNGSATAIVTGPPGPYTYQWSPMGGNGASAQWLTAGTYTVTVTSALGCTGQASVTINQPLTGLTASVTTTPANGCAANGSASVSVSNGQPPFTYSWWPTGGNGATANNLSAGSYMVTISDSNQCVLNYFFTVPSVSGPTVSISNFNGVSCLGGNDGTATVSVSGATGPFSYQWLPSGGTAATATGLSAGNYTCDVIIAPGCTLTATVTIVEPPTAIDMQVASSGTSCGNNNGSITLTTTGGTGSYTYAWTPNVASGSSATGLSAGVYTITVSDGNGCSVTNQVTISPSTQPVITLTNHQNVSCFGLSDGSTGINVTGGTAPLNCQWSTGQSSYLLNSIPAGNYTVTVTDALGCSASLTSVVSQPSQLTATVTQLQHINCFGQSTGAATVATTGGSGNNSWSWTGTTSSVPAISNVAAGSYTATVTDQNGCSASVQVIITQPAAVLSLASNVIETTCGNNDGSINITATGGTAPYSYLWSSGAATASINNLPSGIYTVTVTDQNGCSESLSVTLQASNAPVVTVNSITHVNCYGENSGAIDLAVSGGQAPYTWLWQGSSSTVSSASGLAAGNYIITVTDASGCQAFQQVVVSQPAQLAIQLSQPVTICTGQSATLNGIPSGGSQPYNYSWSNGSITSTINVNPVSATSYVLTVTDSHGCVITAAPVTVTVLPPLSVVAAYPDSVCKGDAASVVITASGGDGNYIFDWSNNLSGSVNDVLIAGDTTFTIVVSDGCTSPLVQTVVTITAVMPPDVSLNVAGQSGCEPFEAQFSVDPGWTPGYIYQWNFGDGFTSSLPAPIHTYTQDGIYDVILTVSYASAGGCSTVLNFPAAVDVKPLPVARFIYDPSEPTRNHPEVYFTDKSTGAVYWYWTFGDGTPEVREQNTVHAYADTGTYVAGLRIQSTDGCQDSTYQVITVKDDLQVYIPNAFTPNASGINDYFKVYGVGFTSYELYIYDRWGKMVYHSKSRDSSWDGNDATTGEPVPQGLYVYKVSIIDNAGNLHNRFNHVTVIR